MELVLAPVLHKKEEPPEAVRVVLPPAQRVVLPLMIAVMPVVTVTVATAFAEQMPLVTCTV